MRAIVRVLVLVACACVVAGTAAPTQTPTAVPSIAPTTAAPTQTPTATPSIAPTTAAPTSAPTASPSAAPTTAAPTSAPTAAPTGAPTTAGPTTAAPTVAPTTAGPTTAAPTIAPTTAAPTLEPTVGPTVAPTDSRAGSINTSYTVTAAVNASAVLSVNASTPPYGLTFTTPNASAATLSVTAFDAANAATIAAQGCGAPDAAYIVTAAFRATRTNSFDALVNVSAYGQVYTTVDRLIWACSYNGTATWTTPAALCANVSSTTTGAAVDGTSVVEPICRSGVYLMVEPLDADRTCVDGLYGCSCDRSTKEMDSSGDFSRYYQAGFSLIGSFAIVSFAADSFSRGSDFECFTRHAYLGIMIASQVVMTAGGVLVALAWTRFLPKSERAEDPIFLSRCSSNFEANGWYYSMLPMIALQLASGIWGIYRANIRMESGKKAIGDDCCTKFLQKYKPDRWSTLSRAIVLAAAAALLLPMSTTLYTENRLEISFWAGCASVVAAFAIALSGGCCCFKSRISTSWVAGIAVDIGEAAVFVTLLMHGLKGGCYKQYLVDAHC
jgi:hypothetical protein